MRDNAKELNKWRAVNEGVMRSKNEMEWRMLEMQAAFERAGLSFIPGEGAGSGSGCGSGGSGSGAGEEPNVEGLSVQLVKAYGGATTMLELTLPKPQGEEAPKVGLRRSA